MLKKLAIIYVVIALINFSTIIYDGVISEAWKNIIFWLSWSLNLLGVLAILGFSLSRTFLNPMYWKVTLVCYISLRMYELLKNGLFVETAPLQQNIMIGLNYTLLVIPSLMAIWYLAYFFNSEKSLITRHSS